jgi:hypothetical protein
MREAGASVVYGVTELKLLLAGNRIQVVASKGQVFSHASNWYGERWPVGQEKGIVDEIRVADRALGHVTESYICVFASVNRFWP